MEDILSITKPSTYSVEQAASYLKRFYLIEREIMRTLGGYLVSVANWELKVALPKHIWQDSLRADALRTRILELRYPRRDVDQDHDPGLQLALAQFIRCVNDAELVEGVYLIVKQALVAGYWRYLQETDPLDDAPTVEFMEQFPQQLLRQIDEVSPLYDALPEVREADEASRQKRLKRQEALQAFWRAVGGVMPEPNVEAHTADLPELLKERPEYEPPEVPVRDPRFGKALYHMPPGESFDFIHAQIARAINHANEMWAAEVPGLLLWKWDDFPWEFYLDLSRWLYDESRHVLMGVKRLEEWGFELGKDIPMCSDMHSSQAGYGELGLLALLHAFECRAPVHKSQMKMEFEQKGDFASARHFDYDWADESIHMGYGYKWLLHRVGDADMVELMKEEAIARYTRHIAELSAQWDYEPYAERIKQKIAERESARHGEL